ncbi:MAG: DUF885 domain-containing protein [Gemmatimonadales bacterium]
MPEPESLYRSCFDLRWHFDPAGATAAGVIEQSGRLGVFDVESMRSHLAAFKALTAALEDAEVADLEAEIDRTALLNDFRVTIARFTHEQPHVRNPGFWLSHLYEAFYGMLERRESPPELWAAAMVERFRAIPAFLDAAAATLSDPAPVLVQAAVAMIDGGEALLGHAAAAAREAYVGLPEDIDRAAADAEAALGRFGLVLKTEMSEGEEHGFASGEEQFNRRLHFQHGLRATAPELWRYGLHRVEELEQQLEETARAIDAGRGWRDQVERLGADSVPASGRLEAQRMAMERARTFVARQDLATLPPGRLEVVETPVFLRPIVPFAMYSPPGPYCEDRTGRFYVTPGDGPGSLAGSRYAMTGTAVHEGYPGHHLHLLTMQTLPTEVRRVLWSPLTVEGWALYCESLMDEAGYYDEPAQRLFHGMNMLWRAVRIILDIGLHTREMSPAAAVLFLRDKIPMSEGEAWAEVRRYCATPTYPLAYALGWREIRRLRTDYAAREGPSFTLRGFHDHLLRYGGLPVTLARWGMGLPEEPAA